jgi:hypothetical protein
VLCDCNGKVAFGELDGCVEEPLLLAWLDPSDEDTIEDAGERGYGSRGSYRVVDTLVAVSVVWGGEPKTRGDR